jgi:hypothetical protein
MVTANKLTTRIHKALVVAGVIIGDYSKTGIAYRKTLHEISGLLIGGITLKDLKERVSKMPYFNFRNNSEEYAKNSWEAFKAAKEADEAKQAELEATTDSSTTSDSDTSDTSE